MKILDPMVGSGTTTTIARLSGHEAFGIDTDPLAVLISSAWSLNVNYDEIIKKASQVYAKAIKTAATLTSVTAFPENCDSNTKKFISYWFDLKNRKQLTALSYHIGHLKDECHRIILWTAFSRMIITKKTGVSLAMDISHSRPHKVYDTAPVSAFEIFLSSVETVLNKTLFCNSNHSKPLSKIIRGDSRHLPFKGSFFDLIITSPPYLNAIDYFRASKLSLVWMGNSVDQIQNWRRNIIGSEVIAKRNAEILNASKEMGLLDNLPNRERGFAFRYLDDMNNVMKEITRVLKVGGRAVLVVGNSTLKDVYISNSKGIISLASSNGLKLKNEQIREILPNRRYLPSPSNLASGKELTSRMRHEVILEFQKS